MPRHEKPREHILPNRIDTVPNPDTCTIPRHFKGDEFPLIISCTPGAAHLSDVLQGAGPDGKNIYIYISRGGPTCMLRPPPSTLTATCVPLDVFHGLPILRDQNILVLNTPLTQGCAWLWRKTYLPDGRQRLHDVTCICRKSDLFRPRHEHKKTLLLVGGHVLHGRPKCEHGGVVFSVAALVLGGLRQLFEVQLGSSGYKDFELLRPEWALQG